MMVLSHRALTQRRCVSQALGRGRLPAPLSEASFIGDTDLTQFLVEHGADVSAEREDASTRQRLASSRSHVDLAQFFIEQGANAIA
jgi:ankyrin repeat protein